MFLIFEARAVLLDREHDGRALLAYNTAALTRAKKPPRLETLLSKRPQRKPMQQSWQEQKRIMFAMCVPPARPTKER